jgi:sporulation protein YlmC with PRC-barrel domain
MKTTLLCGAALAILGVAAIPMSGQTQSTTSTNSTTYIQTSKLIGTKVKAPEGDEVGEIKDVVLDQNGCMAYTVLSTTGGGGGGGGRAATSSTSVKTVAVPWAVYSTTSDPRVLTVRVQKDRIYNAPAFEYSRINEYSTGGYINNVNSYYGVTPGVGLSGSVGGGVSGNATTTNTATNANTGVGAATNAAASASPGASAASSLSTATPAASASASASPSTTPAATESGSPSRRTKAKSGMTPVAPRHKGDQLMSPSGESTSDASPSKHKSDESSAEASPSKKAKHRDTESGEPTATPKSDAEKE